MFFLLVDDNFERENRGSSGLPKDVLVHLPF